MKRACEQIVRELKADRRKLGAVVLLVAVGLLLWGRLMLKNIPQTATATPALSAATAKAAGTGEFEIVDLELGAPGARPVVYVDLPSTLPRDLFVLDVRLYGQRDLGNEGKSGTSLTDSSDRAVALASAGRLRLQSVMLGDNPRAVINGRLVAPGQAAEGWVLIELGDRYVLLKQHGITIRLRM